MTSPLLEVRDLRTYFATERGEARAVDGISFQVQEGETVALVGESGCGKSVTALSILRLLPQPPGRLLAGSSVQLRGEELVCATESRLRDVRGGEISMIFQEPMTSLNPLLTIGQQVSEAIREHAAMSTAPGEREGVAIRRAAIEWLDRVGIPDPAHRYGHYPHQLSGGMRQRVMIAMALSTRPSLLIADEPTTALDVTVQAQILELLASLQRELETAVLLITHDLCVVAHVADRVLVMYAGQIVEEASVDALFRSPQHPYTEGLLQAIPDLDERRERLAEIPGNVPRATAWPPGCRFRPRCPYAWSRCRDAPDLGPTGPAEQASVRCWLVDEPERRSGSGFGWRKPASRGAVGEP
ncbi:MAG: ABC transporter ATP-binding protein [Gemmatimonadales bacterium]|jgi:peptide/nickel transport system ATP-binding protein